MKDTSFFILFAKLILVLGILLVIVGFFKNFSKIGINDSAAGSKKTSASPGASSSITASPLATTWQCVDEKKLSEKMELELVLVRENNLSSVQILECSYQTSQVIKGVNPSLKYSIKQTNTDEEWQALRDVAVKLDTFRRIEEKDDHIFASLNRGSEINQGTFVAKKKSDAGVILIQLSYSPIQESAGDLLRKGTDLTEQLLNETQLLTE